MTTDSSSADTELFVVLGSTHPQRLEAIWQMVEYLQSNNEKVTLCLNEEETDLGDSQTKQRVMEKGLHLTYWQVDPEKSEFTTPPTAFEQANIVILLGHGSKYLVDTLEALSKWLDGSAFELQRITTWVDSQKLTDSITAKKWYECCFHFSDLLILDEFKNLPLPWLKEFRENFNTKSYPCIIENTKKGRLHDLYLIMDNQVRRISQVFEESDDLYFDVETEVEEEDEELEDEDILNQKSVDPYFERSPDGRRSKPVPDLEEHT
jgi:hypothetical protein